MGFTGLIGQDRALAALDSALARGALHHAYLFAGPSGVGKATAARLLAQAGNCLAERDRPCGECPACRKVARGTHPDVIALAEERVMAKAGRWEPRGGRAPSKDIVVDQVRDLVDHRLALKRVEGRHRFVLVDPADAMNPQAQNALLKTLEEPPDGTTLVLVASRPDALLPTIRSRCARVVFSPIPDALVAERLVALGRAPDDARLVAALASGSLGRALALDAGALAARQKLVAAAAALDPDDASGWIAYAREAGKDREAARETCELLRIWLRDVLAVQAAGGAPVGALRGPAPRSDPARRGSGAAPLALGDLSGATGGAALALRPAEVLRRVELARDAIAALRQNAAPALALERMLIGWFHGDRG